MASGGTGSVPYLVGELFQAMAGIKMIHVPYRGALPALTDVISGQAQVTFTALTTSIEYITARQVDASAVTTVAPSEVLPNIQALDERLALAPLYTF